jgi:glycosyltransferase involved in cell wall biosynthesis
MTRVLFWCDAFWPLIGGVEVLAARVVVALAERGHEFVVVADQQANLDARAEFHGIPVHRAPYLEILANRRMDDWMAARAKVTALKREYRADLVWVYHINLDVMFHLMTAAAHRSATLCTVHGAFPDGTVAPETAFGRVLRAADWVTACSAHALGETRRQIPELAQRSSVIRNGLAMPSLAPAALSSDLPRLLCVGRIGSVDEKGFDVAIRAMPAVLARFPSARLAIAGDGPARKELMQIASDAGVTAQVDFLGWVHPDRVLELMNESSMVLMPSRVPEGFGLVALQAAQMGRPVVASGVGGVSEVVVHGETGLLVDPDDADALAVAVMSLLADPERAARMGQAGRRRAATELGWEQHVDAYDELLQRFSARVMETA